MKSDIMKVIAVVLAIAGVSVMLYWSKVDGDRKMAEVTTRTVVDGKTNTVVEVVPIARSVKRNPLETEATKRLHEGPVIVSSLFEASGLAEHASFGKAVRGSYLYTTTVIAQSKIMEKTEDKATGRVHVVERRKFVQARDSIALSDMDVALALDTLPVDQVKGWVDNACELVRGACEAVTSSVSDAALIQTAVEGGVNVVKKAMDDVFAALHEIDGASARAMLGSFGVKVPDNIEKFVNEWLSKEVNKEWAKVHTALQSIEGKSFLISYTQDLQSGKAVCNVDYANEDGSPISDSEWEILRSANAFLDANVVPDKRCRVGDSWTVWADEVQELFGAAGDGRADGKIHVKRVADQPDGSWTLQIEPAEIQFRTDDGTAAGKMSIKDGNGIVDAENVAVKSLQASASGNLRSLNKKRHLLFFDFVKRLEGNSNLRFTLKVSPSK